MRRIWRTSSGIPGQRRPNPVSLRARGTLWAFSAGMFAVRRGTARASGLPKRGDVFVWNLVPRLSRMSGRMACRAVRPLWPFPRLRELSPMQGQEATIGNAATPRGSTAQRARIAGPAACPPVMVRGGRFQFEASVFPSLTHRENCIWIKPFNPVLDRAPRVEKP